MQVLLDTHALLWFLTDNPRLPEKWRLRLTTGETRVFYSSVSILEIAIKHSLKPEAMPCPPEEVEAAAEASGLTQIPFTSAHAKTVGLLPWLHRDPFDRMLLAQARTEGFVFLSHDENVIRYGDSVRGF
jgi:PIN domain nuclease of toxin-antitoxin system